MKKELYQQPNTKVLVVRFEGCILVVSGGANYSNTRGGVSGSDSYEDGESF